MLQGKQITCYPSLHQCKLRDINKKTAVEPGLLTESFVHSWVCAVIAVILIQYDVIFVLNIDDARQRYVLKCHGTFDNSRCTYIAQLFMPVFSYKTEDLVLLSMRYFYTRDEIT